MKKLISVLVALSLVVGVAFTAMADSGSKEFDTGKETDPDTIPFTCNTISVTVNVDDGTAKTRYNVKVEWKDLSFTYDRSGTSWNPSDHTYTGTAVGWSNDGKIAEAIKVSNHSNAPVSVSYTAPAAKDGVTVALKLEQADANLLAADSEGIYGDYSKADYVTYEVSVSGVPANDTTFTISPVTIVIAKAA